MSVFRCFLLVFGCALIPCLSSQPTFAKEPFSLRKLRKEIKGTITSYTQQKPGELNPEKTPGVSVSILYFGSEKKPFGGKKLNVVSGYSNPHTDYDPIPINDKMLFELGSITKSATAALILHFIGRGVDLNNHPFTLDSTLKSLQPALAGKAFNPKATVRQLLNMTSGIRDFKENINYLIIANPEEALQHFEAANNSTMAELMKNRMRRSSKIRHKKQATHLSKFGPYHVPTGRPTDNQSPARFWTPSDVYNIVRKPKKRNYDWNYSSTNYVICGQYIQGLFNHADLDQAFHKILFHPHRIHLFLGSYDRIGPQPIAAGWSSSGVNVKSQSRIAFLSSYGASGGLLGKAADAARLALTIWSPDVSFLEPEYLKEMVTGVPCPPLYECVAGERVAGIEVSAYGLGTSLVDVTLDDQDQRIVKLVGNNGKTRGFHTAAFYLHERKVAFAILANSGKNHVTGKHVIEMERDLTRILMKYERPR